MIASPLPPLSVSAHHRMTHPPKPRLTLRIGVTGHRPNRLAAGAADILARSIKQLLTRTIDTLRAVHAQHKASFSDDAPRLIVVSALAAGSDCIVAKVAHELGLELSCPLPFFRDEYENDFTDAEEKALYRRLLGRATVFELEGSRASKADEDRAYEAAGLFVLRQSDAVIAVWNGEIGAGRGGTHDIVQAAISAGIPIFRYDEQGGGPSLLLPPDGSDSVNARDLIEKAQLAKPEEIDARLRALVEPPKDEPGTDAYDRLEEYFQETERPKNYWAAYPILLRMFAGKKGVRTSLRPRAYLTAADSDWDRDFWQPVSTSCSIDAKTPNAEFTPANIREVLQPRFAWADGLAIYYGQAYRSSYVLAFSLGGIAVFFAVVPLVLHALLELLEWKSEFLSHMSELVPAIAALTAIGSVIALVFFGRQARRHEKWMDYRLLAERLRVIRVLALTGSPMPELRMPHSDEKLRSQQSWVTWYVRATLRDIGIPKGRGNHSYAEMAKCALLKAELEGQSNFHASYALRERHVGERLENLGRWLFACSAVLTAFAVVYFAAVVVHVIDGDYLKVVADLTMFVAAAFPGLGAAFFSIRSHGEFERNAKLSEAARDRLESITKRVLATPSPTFAGISRATDETAAVLTGELSDWRFVFWGKPLTLPG